MEAASCPYLFKEWQIIESEFNPELLAQSETIFATGNGYIGMRGNFEEGTPCFFNGTYLNGFYESTSINYPESAYGFAQKFQTMLNVTDGRTIRLLVNQEQFDLNSGTLLNYRRVLDMRRGLLLREIEWRSTSGIELLITNKRFVSLNNKHLALFSYSVKLLNRAAEIQFCSLLDGSVENRAAEDDPRVGSKLKEKALVMQEIIREENFNALSHRTENSSLSIVCGMGHNLVCRNLVVTKTFVNAEQIEVRFTLSAERGETARLVKYLVYYTSLDYPAEDLKGLSRKAVLKARERGFESLLADQHHYLDKFWQESDIMVQGEAELQQNIRFNIFQLLQSAGKDGITSIPAKGLTGEGYSGHYFWDAEIYVIPFFIYTNPEIARRLLEYRFHILDKARWWARKLGHKGALYPWRTINGEEASAYYPAGTAQYHINADISYTIRKYLEATGDTEFLLSRGAEIIFETARFWVDLGDYIPSKDDSFCLNCVTGPDEYTALVNNNTYTNLMAGNNLEYAVEIAARLREDKPEAFGRIAEKINLTDSEIAEWQKAARAMVIPFDTKLGIHPQDDSFLAKAFWNFEHDKNKHPLLLYYHPLEIYRHQVLKQPDVVLIDFLLGDRSGAARKKRNFDYYDPLTTGDSSLAPSIQSIMASELGYSDLAYGYFLKTLRMDLYDIYRNVQDGVHMAAMAGTWLSIVYGFAGMRTCEGKISFSPHLPVGWPLLQFSIRFQNCLLQVKICRESATYILLAGTVLVIEHEKRLLALHEGEQVSIDLSARPEAVLFDLDGVVTDTAEYHYQAWLEIAREIGADFNRELDEKLKGVSREECLEILLQHNKLSFSREKKQALAEKKNYYYLNLINKINPQDLLPGIAPLLKELKKEGVKTALASASRNAPEVIRRLQLEKDFDVIVDSGKMCMGKPDPEIFFSAADQLNISYRNCIGIEDAQVGIEAIKNAGMFAVGIGRGLQGADLLLYSTSELKWQSMKEQFIKRNASGKVTPPEARNTRERWEA
ncbi:MAG TPA: beta-phosphoglucomutase [Spirochaetales bacterium]|nr:beta-phosphoglucomutase [Spirochaetales bacterium]